MIGALQGTSENLTLSERELSACGPVAGEGGRVLRAYCPFHGSDRQRSLRLDLRSGRFSCFACGAWGYTQQAREQWRRERARSASETPASGKSGPGVQRHPGARQEAHRLSEGLSAAATAGIPSLSRQAAPAPHAQEDLEASLRRYQEALPGSWGEEYLKRRHVPLQLALEGIVNLTGKVAGLVQMETKCKVDLPRYWELTPPLPPLLPRSRPGIVADVRLGTPLPSYDAVEDRSVHGSDRRQTGSVGRAGLT